MLLIRKQKPVQEPVATIICFFSNGYTQECVESLRKHFPDMFVLFIDNNPNKVPVIPEPISDYERKLVRDTNKFAGACQVEKDWIRSVPNSTVVETGKWLQHGQAIQLAFDWHIDNGVKRLLHLEPDCFVSGREWLTQLEEPMNSGAWVVWGGVTGTPDSPAPDQVRPHLTPSLWQVDKAWRYPYGPVSSLEDETEPWYKQFALPYETNIHVWDTGVKAFLECWKKGKAVSVRLSDFVHYYRRGCMRYSVKSLLM